MSDEKRINTKQLAEDIRSGMDDKTLLRKYRIGLKELRDFKRRVEKDKAAVLESLEHDLRDTVSVTLEPDGPEPRARTKRTGSLEPEVRDTIIMAPMDSKTDIQGSGTTQRLGDIEPDLRETVLIELMDTDDAPKGPRKTAPSKGDDTPEDLLITIISSDALDVSDGGDDTIRLVDEPADFVPRSDDHTVVPRGPRKKKPQTIPSPSEGPAAEIAKTQQLNMLPQPPEISVTEPKSAGEKDPPTPPQPEKPARRSFLGRKSAPPATTDEPKPPRRSLFGRKPKDQVPGDEEKPPKRWLFGRKPKDKAPNEEDKPAKRRLFGRKSPTPATVDEITPQDDSATQTPADKPGRKSAMIVVGALAVTVVGVVLIWGLFGDYLMSDPDEPKPLKPMIVRQTTPRPPAPVRPVVEPPQPGEDQQKQVAAGLSGGEPSKPRDGKRSGQPVRSGKDQAGISETAGEKPPDKPAEPIQQVAKAPAPSVDTGEPESPTSAPAVVLPEKNPPTVEPPGMPSPGATRSPARLPAQPERSPEVAVARSQSQERRVAAVPSSDSASAPELGPRPPRRSRTEAGNRMEEALIAAVKARDVQKVGMFLARKADVNSNNNRNGTTPLVEAATIGDLGLANLFTEKGADVNAKTKDGRTALFAAVTGGHKEMVQFLLDKGADPNAKNNAGVTPLDEAGTRRRADLERLMRAKLTIAQTAPAKPEISPQPKEPGKAVHRNELDAYEALSGDSRSVYEAIR